MLQDAKFQFRLDKELKERFLRSCREKEDTPTQVLREAVALYVVKKPKIKN